jgi:predicted amidophosphoribosyltransferase
VVPAAIYDSAARRLLLRAKEGGWPALFRPLARQLEVALIADGSRFRDATLVPVPSHPLRGIRRGFAPADELARHLSRRTNRPLERLIRHRWTRWRPQKRLSLAERRRSRNTTFTGVPKYHPGPVLLVDDVMTSGTTVSACASVLASLGARDISVAVWARALPRSEQYSHNK